MAFKIEIKREFPEGIIPARYIPEFEDEFAEMTEIMNSSLVTPIELIDTPETSVIQDPERGGNVVVQQTSVTYNTLEDANYASDLLKDWDHPKIIAYNTANDIRVYNRIVNTETNEVVRDWAKRK